MADQWFYLHDGLRMGPCSARQLQEVAASGGLLPLDMVWRHGTLQGALAKKVKYLFPLAPDLLGLAALPPPVPLRGEEEELAEDGELTGNSSEDSDLPTREKTPAAPKQPPRAKAGRALAVVGVVIVSQDGTRVHFKKKCTKCGLEDSCRNSMLIKHGRTRVAFFCPKCKKSRPVEIQGITK